jgi:hypothetical protein
VAYLIPLSLGLVAVGLVATILVTFRAAQARQRALRSRLSDVKELAWSHRELEPDLAAALIAQIEGFQKRSQATPEMFDALLDTAWSHRETSPALSTILVDEVRAIQRREIEP